MPNSKIRLVHSDTPTNKAIDARIEWSLENARQLELFDDFDRIKIFFVPMADVTAHSFRKALLENSPKLLLDTREFPDFFSIFNSTKSALEEFRRREIEYNRVQFHTQISGKSSWNQVNTIRSILHSHLEKRTGTPVFVLSSTRKKLDKISNALRGYISQEVAEVNFEEICG